MCSQSCHARVPCAVATLSPRSLQKSEAYKCYECWRQQQLFGLNERALNAGSPDHEPVNILKFVSANLLGQDMAVRGAPAIAIAGALALAVDLHNNGKGKQFATAKDAQSYIDEQMAFLVTR